jgi:hypothetical protein
MKTSHKSDELNKFKKRGSTNRVPMVSPEVYLRDTHISWYGYLIVKLRPKINIHLMATPITLKKYRNEL